MLAKIGPRQRRVLVPALVRERRAYAPVTGYFSVTQNADRGIEASENDLLTGESNALFWQRIKAVFTGEENRGASIETSINTTLQTVAAQELGDQDGSVVAIEPSTGRILAMVSSPSYDPNALATHDTGSASKAYTELVNDDSNPMLNRATSQLYPPGSTFKTVVAAAAPRIGQNTSSIRRSRPAPPTRCPARRPS